MNVDFARFRVTDGLELQGWLSSQDSDLAVVHIHGMSGNGYENRFLDTLRERFCSRHVSFFSIDTRGFGVMSLLWKSSESAPTNESHLGGSCYEIFEDCVHDIQGSIDFLRTRGCRRFILEGHSLGATKVVHYLSTKPSDVVAAILLAPTDMRGWAALDPNHERYLQEAKELVKEGKGEALVGCQCWSDKTPLSARTYLSIAEMGSCADIYSERGEGALLGKVATPTLVVYGDRDVGVLEIDGSIESWLKRVSRIRGPGLEVAILEGADHGFRGFEEALTETVIESGTVAPLLPFV